ncbi:hypothetical protein LTR74_001044 [Friedmanniomyces endolithicus]|uniref:N-acetyltransferase domain-containing protein n=1 Tax=Friedmanniomyces endolithicus TaxID=329885 RepID=A0AAN6FI04_9PEZI|nr:hypothetical protein LTR82_010847 [Friedmanniomyces endolithicus]KAK1074448.1 hypothetical protein LTR74_001044 [Friedmanniomyces endolithicus]
MRVNQHHVLTTRKVLLLPYSAHHVPTYHTWMQDPELQSATASEPLTLDEEYAMQVSWREDADKLTFIVCLPLADPIPRQAAVQVGVHDSPERMVGDINLFLSQPADDDEDDDEDCVHGSFVGEIEVMIARKDLHRQGYGRAALLIFMGYIIFHWPTICLEYETSLQQAVVPQPEDPPNQEEEGLSGDEATGSARNACALPASTAKNSRLSLRYLRVKIHQSNIASIKLFESVGYKRTRAGKANYFGEVELRWQDDGGFLRRLKELLWMEGDEWEADTMSFH